MKVGKRELLHALEWHEDGKVVDYLMAGGDPNLKLQRHSMLIHAIRGGLDKATVQLIVEKGANVNDNDNPESTTPLIEAVTQGYGDHFFILIRHGADVNGRDIGNFTPLMKDAMHGIWTVMTDTLLSHGADINARNVWGHTAADVARRNGRAEYAARLESYDFGF